MPRAVLREPCAPGGSSPIHRNHSAVVPRLCTTVGQRVAPPSLAASLVALLRFASRAETEASA